MKRSLSTQKLFICINEIRIKVYQNIKSKNVKKKNIHWMRHILKGYLQDFVCVCVVCVCGRGGGLKSIQYIITLDMKQWIYDKIFKIYDKYKTNLPSGLKEIMKNQNNRNIKHIHNSTSSQKVFVNFYQEYLFFSSSNVFEFAPKITLLWGRKKLFVKYVSIYFFLNNITSLLQ